MNLRPLTSYETKIFAFMDARDYTRAHGERLRKLEADWADVWFSSLDLPISNHTTDRLDGIAAEREEVISRAVERYEDWASD